MSELTAAHPTRQPTTHRLEPSYRLPVDEIIEKNVDIYIFTI